MTGMLASVVDGAEAQLAVAAGADIVDLKDPGHGALGALPLETISEALAAVGRRRPVSATLGDLPMEPSLLVERARALAATGVDFVKIGLFDQPARAACIEALAPVARAVPLVGVLFADQRPDMAIVAELAKAGFAGVMLDTADKSAGALRARLDDSSLARFVAVATERGLMCGLAGSLSLHDIAPLLALRPDYLGFRGALCAGRMRSARIDVRALHAVREAIPRNMPPEWNRRGAISGSPASFPSAA